MKHTSDKKKTNLELLYSLFNFFVDEFDEFDKAIFHLEFNPSTLPVNPNTLFITFTFDENINNDNPLKLKSNVVIESEAAALNELYYSNILF